MSNKTEFFTWLGEAAKYGPALQRYEKLEHEIRLLSGYTLDELRYMLAKGFTLTPPPKPMTLTEALDIDNGDKSCFGKYYDSYGHVCEDGAAALCRYHRECKRNCPEY